MVGALLSVQPAHGQALHDGALVDRLIKAVRSAGTLSRSTIEKSIGVRLHRTGHDDYYQSYVSGPRQDGMLELDLDLREPKPHSGATGGALLVVNVADGCATKAAVEARYGPLQLEQVPHGDSLDEQSVWARTEAWGTLSFGFTERQPDCVKTVVFSSPAAS